MSALANTITPHSSTCWFIYLGADKLGHFSKTSREHPDMQWYWEAAGKFGYAATRDQAVDGVLSRAPDFLQFQAMERGEQAEFDALPEDLKPLRIELDRAKVEVQREWHRTVFNEANYRAASDRAYAAELAFNKAKDRREIESVRVAA